MYVVLYVGVGDNRAILDNLSFSFVSYIHVGITVGPPLSEHPGTKSS